MQSISGNGYTRDEVLETIQGPVRKWSFRYELLDSDNNKIDDLTNIFADGNSISYNALADIKRTAKFTMEDGGGIDFTSDRIKPYARIELPAKNIQGTATGGTTTESDGYVIHTISADDDFVISGTIQNAEYLVVAGGGGGGGGSVSAAGGSGGGAGGVLTGSTTLSEGTQSVTIGAGGAADTNGSDTVFGTLATATGGGHGGEESGTVPSSGGSGGGATQDNTTGAAGVSGQGNKGGDIGAGGTEASAGGGGAGAVGGDTGPSARDAGDGGDGIEWPSGSGNFFGGGGGGSNGSGGTGGFVSAGGAGGGGRGHSGSGNGEDGTDGLGGGGGATRSGTPGSGGSGVVMVRYPKTILNDEEDRYIEWPLGVFLLSTPSRTTLNTGQVVREVEGYDQLQVVRDDRVDDRYIVTASSVVTDEIKTLLDAMGISSNITPSSAVMPADREWPVGTTKLEILNTLTTTINYEALFFDADGNAVVRPYQSPQDLPSEYTYTDDDTSVILPEVEQERDLFDIANKWILAVSEPELDPITATYTNSNPASPTSTVSRGRTIVDFREEQDAVDELTLEAKAERLAFEASQVYEAVEFETGLMPFHGHADVIRLQFTSLGIDNKYREHTWELPLKAGQTMKHRIRRVVSV